MGNNDQEKKKRNRTVYKYTDEMIEAFADKLIAWVEIPLSTRIWRISLGRK